MRTLVRRDVLSCVDKTCFFSIRAIRVTVCVKVRTGAKPKACTARGARGLYSCSITSTTLAIRSVCINRDYTRDKEYIKVFFYIL